MDPERKRFDTLLSAHVDHPEMSFPDGLSREEFAATAEEIWDRSPQSAYAFVETSKSALPVLSKEAFDKWVFLGRKILETEVVPDGKTVAPKVVPRGTTIDAQQKLTGSDSELCREYFLASPAILSEKAFHYLSYWVEQDLEIAEVSLPAAIQYLRSTPAFLQHEDVFRLRPWATAVRQILARGEGGEEAAISYIQSSARLLQFMTFRELRDWAATGIEMARESTRLASTYFAIVPEGLESLYSTEWLKICQIGSLLVKTHPEDVIDLYARAPRILVEVSPAVRNMVLESARQALPENPEWVTSILDSISRALPPLPNPAQETVIKHEIAIKERSYEASIAYLRNIGHLVDEIDGHLLPYWIEKGISLLDQDEGNGIGYFSLLSPESDEERTKWREAVLLEDYRSILTIFANAIAGRALRLKSEEEIEAKDQLPVRVLPASDGRSIYLPGFLAGEASRRENFREYKVAVAHQAGYVAYDTFGEGLLPILSEIEALPLARLAQDIFFVLEDCRIDHRIREEYPGLAAEIDLVLDSVMESRPLLHELALQEALVEILLRLTLGRFDDREAPREAARHLDVIRGALAGFPGQARSVWDSYSRARIIYDYVSKLPASTSYGPLVPLRNRGSIELDSVPGPSRYPSSLDEITEIIVDEEDLDPLSVEGLDGAGKKTTIPPDARFIEADDIPARGQFMTDADGIQTEGRKRHPDQGDQSRTKSIVIPSSSRSTGKEGPFYYDEWDYLAKGYRRRWCCLRESMIRPAPSGLFDEISARYSDLIQRVTRQFQRIRPEMLEIVRRVEWGDEMDLPAVVRGAVERRAGMTPSEKIFIRRERKIRRIAFLFLLDMSASTSETVPGDGDGENEKRVIDVEIEGLVVIMEALQALSDEYGVFGFSGYGRENVDFYRIKDFSDTYSESLKQRICNIQPQQGTRMGPAIRHAIQRLKSVDSDQRVMLLLSDGYPQDHDYGEDRRSREYGLHDTMMALLEAKKEGIKPFCITVDQSGYDYLRKMCDPSSYLIIRDINSLPETLPKVVESLMG